ncbi:MAG: diacylglycerol kinase family protein [Pseudomonadota bacterium]
MNLAIDPALPLAHAEALDRAKAAAASGPVFVVMNAGSGSGDAQARQDAIESALKEAGRDYRFLIAMPGRSVAKLAREAADAAQSEGGLVVAVGGDGTLSAVAQALSGSATPLAVVPQGTFNYFGRAHGVPQDAGLATRAFLHGSIEPVQTGHLNGQVFLVNASLGLYPKLLEDREAYKQQYGRSRLVAFAAGIATLLGWRGQMSLEAETRQARRVFRTTTLFVGNNQLQLARVGLAAPQIEALERNLLTAVAVKPIRTGALLWLLLRGLAGKLGEADNIDSFSFHRMKVSPRGVRRVKVALDGEVQWMRTPLLFEVAPHPLWLVVPAAEDRAEVA